MKVNSRKRYLKNRIRIYYTFKEANTSYSVLRAKIVEWAKYNLPGQEFIMTSGGYANATGYFYTPIEKM